MCDVPITAVFCSESIECILLLLLLLLLLILLLLSFIVWGGWLAPLPRRLCPRARNPVPIVLEAVWVPRPVWTGAEGLAPTVIRSPEHPARSGRYTD